MEWKEKERGEIVKTEKNVREGNMTSTPKEDIRMMMATEGMGGAIASGIAIALLAIDPLIATVKVTIADQTVKKDGPECLIGEIRARVSHIS